MQNKYNINGYFLFTDNKSFKYLINDPTTILINDPTTILNDLLEDEKDNKTISNHQAGCYYEQLRNKIIKKQQYNSSNSEEQLNKVDDNEDLKLFVPLEITLKMLNKEINKESFDFLFHFRKVYFMINNVNYVNDVYNYLKGYQHLN